MKRQTAPPIAGILHVAAFIFLLLPPSAAISDEKKPPAITLTIDEATATKSDDGDTLFLLKVTIKNATGADIAVLSRFGSALDLLDLVVTDTDGKQVAQQGNTFHQSPRLKPREFVIKAGETTRSMAFPISGIGRVGDKLNVQLLGVLPGDIDLRSQTVKLTVKGS